MKLLPFTFALTSVFLFVHGFNLSSKLVSDFLNAFNLNQGVIFYCDFSSIDELKLLAKNELKFLSFFDISTSKLSHKNMKSSLKLDYRQIGVIFDLSCNETNKIFEDFSRWNYFNSSYNWLLMSKNYEKSLEDLKGKNVNLNSEICLAVYDQSRDVEIFDIYNPNPRTNGKIVSKSIGNWSESEGLKLSLDGTKFERRLNLQGAVINAGVVATASFMKNRTLIEYMESKLKKNVDKKPIN